VQEAARGSRFASRIPSWARTTSTRRTFWFVSGCDTAGVTVGGV
jgi:hypothetical protein